MTTSPQAPPPGLSVGGYALRARLGEGGMGVVHLGQRPGERPVAIKVLRPHIVGDDEARQRLAREVSSLSRIRSRRVAEIVDADPWGDVPYVATRYVPGLALHDHVQEEGPLAGDDLVWLADCLAEALQAVHAVGVLHRDVKPSNVVMEGRTPILIDFGLARVADDPRLTMTGWLLGTPGYLAPEILHGDDATAASDVHAWAATVAFAGLGRAPFGSGPSMAVMDRVRRGEHDLRGLDPRVRPVVEEALAPAPHDRPPLAEVREWLTGLSGHSAPPAGPVPEPSPVTVPMAAALHQDLVAPTRVGTPSPQAAPWTQDLPQQRPTHVLPPGTHPWDEHDHDLPARASAGERLRRTVLVLVLGAAVVAGIVLAPYVALALLATAAWLLRSGSLAASRVGDRRRLRGVRWYDGVQVLLAAPWHLVSGGAGTLLLLTWSLGIGTAVALCCFAASFSMTASLALIGGFFALGMWWGPGSGRLRSPVHRVVDRLAGQGVVWTVAVLLVGAVASGLGAAATSGERVWSPDDGAPFSDVRLPAWL